MAILILVVILLGAVLNGGTAVMEREDVARHSLYGAAGGAAAVAVLFAIFWGLNLFMDIDFTTLEL